MYFLTEGEPELSLPVGGTNDAGENPTRLDVSQSLIHKFGAPHRVQ